MASISVRKISDQTVAALRARAAKAGVSMEEEVRRILDETVKREESAGEMMERIFSRSWDGERFEVPPINGYVEPMKFRDEA
ncbi:hypothetical protein [Hyphomonas sp.]|uniref:FitA-like ribbon-helix-helix domain-containing protein n=1 Tax=Hyphomonas sp. TaxID=87 RepID=UPI0033420CFD